MTYIVLLTVVTTVQLQSQMLAAMQANELPTSSWSKDGLWQNLVNWFAILYQGLYGILRIVAENAFLKTATGQGLIDLGQGTFGTTYRGKTFANGTVTLLNSSGIPLDELAESISFGKVGSPDVTYRNSGAVFILNGNQLAIPVVCDVAGTVGNVLADNSAPFNLEMIDTILGVSIVEHSAFVGQDEQPEDEYKALCTKQAASRSIGGAQGAWEWYPPLLNTDGTVSESGDGKTRVNVNRVSVSESSSTGITTLVVASPVGPVDAGEFATIETFMQQNVKNSGTLLQYNCIAVDLDIVAAIQLERGTPSLGAADALEQYVTDWFGTTENMIGGGGEDAFTVDELIGIIFRGNSKIRKVTITTINGSPPADVALAFNESAQAGTMTFTVTVQP